MHQKKSAAKNAAKISKKPSKLQLKSGQQLQQNSSKRISIGPT